MIIQCGAKIFLRERIAAIETRSIPLKPGWPEDNAAHVLVDCGTHGHWICLDDEEWRQFQNAVKQEPKKWENV